MREVTARDMCDQFDECLELVKVEPIGICEAGKRVAVMMSAEEYEHFQKLEDVYWAARAKAAEKRGKSVGHEAATRVLTRKN